MLTRPRPTVYPSNYPTERDFTVAIVVVSDSPYLAVNIFSLVSLGFDVCQQLILLKLWRARKKTVFNAKSLVLSHLVGLAHTRLTY